MDKVDSTSLEKPPMSTGTFLISNLTKNGDLTGKAKTKVVLLDQTEGESPKDKYVADEAFSLEFTGLIEDVSPD